MYFNLFVQATQNLSTLARLGKCALITLVFVRELELGHTQMLLYQAAKGVANQNMSFLNSCGDIAWDHDGVIA